MTTPSDRFADDGEQGAQLRHPAPEDPLSGCELFESVAAELALGSLTGTERSAALAHLEDCDDCRVLIKDLSNAADALLLAAPEADPPAGFEVRLLARLHRGDAGAVAPSTTGHARVIPLRRRARVILAAAAAAIVIAGAGIGLGTAVAPRHATQTAASRSRVAVLRTVATSSTPARVVGEVAITGGTSSWVVMTFHKPHWSGWVYCVVSENGQAKVLGSFWLEDGSGSWAVPFPSSVATVSSAQIEGINGAVFATASFAA
jgi:hypothetical protein